MVTLAALVVAVQTLLLVLVMAEQVHLGKVLLVVLVLAALTGLVVAAAELPLLVQITQL
jgi:hypothetical protein